MDLTPSFTFRTSPEIVFGTGAVRTLPAILSRFGRRGFLVLGATSLERSGTLGRIEEELVAAGIGLVRANVHGEPDVLAVDEVARGCRSAASDFVVAIGGGSVLDTAKAVAALATNEGSVLEYLEGQGVAPRPLARTPLPVIALPTTAGSGSEVTRNSVVRIRDARVKRSMRDSALVPRVALVDPELSASAPRAVAASAGLDALTHLIEAYVSLDAQPLTDLVALSGIGVATRALEALALGTATPGSHAQMAKASLWGGLALANAGLGATHGLVAPLGGRYDVPHGAGCGCLLAATVRVNALALRQRAPGSPALARYGEIARAITPGGGSDILAAADALDRLRSSLGIGTLASYGVDGHDLAPIILQSRSGSMRSNPIDLTDAELEAILRASLGVGAARNPETSARPRR